MNADLHDVLTGNLLFRGLPSESPPTDETVRALVDEELIRTLISSRKQ